MKKQKTILLLIILVLFSISATNDPNPYLARTACDYTAIAWKSPPFETTDGWVYFVSLNNITVIPADSISYVGNTKYWIAEVSGRIDLMKTYVVYGVVELSSGGSVWTEEVKLTCNKIFLPQMSVGW